MNVSLNVKIPTDSPTQVLLLAFGLHTLSYSKYQGFPTRISPIVRSFYSHAHDVLHRKLNHSKTHAISLNTSYNQTKMDINIGNK